MVLPVGDEVALALELDARLRCHRRERGLDLGATQDFERGRVQRGLQIVLVVGLGLVGLAALTPYLDYVLFPILGLFLILAYYGWSKTRKGI